jgi:hypothetical protein
VVCIASIIREISEAASGKSVEIKRSKSVTAELAFQYSVLPETDRMS